MNSMRNTSPFLLAAALVASCGPYSITSRTGAYKNADEAAARTMSPCPEGLIDDGEDNNGQVRKVDGRGGYWFTFADTEGTTVAPKGDFVMGEGGANGSAYAGVMKGKVATSGDSLYVGLGFKLTESGVPYDASKAKGVSFWARAKGEAVVRFKTPDVNTEPSGGVCDDCYNDFGMDIALTDEWQHFTVPFELMRQQDGWGNPRPPAVAKDKLFAIQWQYSKPGSEFEIAIDDVELVGCVQ